MTEWPMRRAVAGDAPALAMVAAASFLETFAGLLPGADIVDHCRRKSSVEAFEAWLGDPDVQLTIAEHPHGAAPVGYAVVTPPDLPIASRAGDVELRRIYTLAIARGTGLGHRLMAAALADARARGGTRLLLGVFKGNARACAFYEREGFTVAGERQFRVGSGTYDDLIYGRAI